MFVIKNIKQYREYLEVMTRNMKKNGEVVTRQKDKSYYAGIFYGIELAQQGLDDWEKSLEGTDNVQE
jgi:hypothetical protein